MSTDPIPVEVSSMGKVAVEIALFASPLCISISIECIEFYRIHSPIRPERIICSQRHIDRDRLPDPTGQS